MTGNIMTTGAGMKVDLDEMEEWYVGENSNHTNVALMIAELRASREVVEAVEPLAKFCSRFCSLEDRDNIDEAIQKYRDAVK